MKRTVFTVIIMLILVMFFAACGWKVEIVDSTKPVEGESELVVSEDETEEQEENDEEEPTKNKNVVFKIGEKDYTVNATAGTVIADNGNGSYQIDAPFSAKEPVNMDFSALAGCEEIKELYVYAHTDAKSIVVPKLPNLESLHIFGINVKILDVFGTGGIKDMHICLLPEELKIGAGPEMLTLDSDLDLAKLAGAKNIKSFTVYGDKNLSLVADIGEVEEIYIIGDEKNLGELKNLKSLKHLSVYGMGLDFSPIEDLTVETLVISDIATKDFIDSFTYSETLTELQMDDEFLYDASFLEKMPNLKKLLLIVSPEQDEAVTLWNETPLEKEIISMLKTNIPKEQLEAFVEKGGEIYLAADTWRNS